jgi:hypothetical protein
MTRYPFFVDNINVNAMIAKPLTCMAAKLYQPNMVENQCASNDMITPKANIGKVKAKYYQEYTR